MKFSRDVTITEHLELRIVKDFDEEGAKRLAAAGFLAALGRPAEPADFKALGLVSKIAVIDVMRGGVSHLASATTTAAKAAALEALLAEIEAL